MIPSRRMCRAIPSLACLLALLALSSGCARFGSFAKSRADRAAYAIIDEKAREVLDGPLGFTIEPVEDEATQRALEHAGRVNLLDDTVTTPSHVLTLSDTLAIAFANSRSYQSSKETLFQQALSLTESRWDFQPLWSASGEASLNRSESGHGTLAGATTEWFGSHNLAASVRKTFATGATISAALTQSYTKYFTGASRSGSNPAMSFDIVQPLLNGAGSLVAHEPLRQAERDMIYKTRTFLRSQNEFAIGIVSSYYALLQSLDSLRNQRMDYESAVYSAERSAAWADAGWQSELEADQARQQVLAARNRWNARQADYLGQIDAFKIQLGLPVDLDIGPDPHDMVLLRDRGLTEIGLVLPEAIEIALDERLDLDTAADNLEDADRAVRIALRNFLPNLDLGYNYSTSENRGKDRLFPRFRDNEQQWRLDLALPLDWTPRRNSYRNALISRERQQRSLEEKRDNVVLEVKTLWRDLEFERKNHEIQIESVRLAERQLESSLLLQEQGRAVQRDITEAQENLLAARDSLTASLVSYTVKRLRFWHAIERLKIDPKGMWYELDSTREPVRGE